MRPLHHNRDWNEIDIDSDAPPCTEHCRCPLCVASDVEENRLLFRLDGPDIDLGALAIAAARPWREGAA